MRLIPKTHELGWTPFAWLIYLSFFLVAPTMGKTTALTWAATIAATVAFLVLYFRGFWVHGRELVLIMAGITAIGVVFWPFNPGAGAFFIYAAAFAAHVGSTRRGILLIAGIEVVIGVEIALTHMQPVNAAWPALFVLLIGGVNLHYAQVARANARLRLAHDEIEHLAKVAERERIARDLHDLLGHTLSLIILKSELATKLAERDPRRAREEIRDVERISRAALAEVRQAVRGYRAGGLASEIRAAAEMLRTAGVELTCDIEPLLIAASHEAILALALRESVTNVARHARATRCTIRLDRRGADVCLSVSDDGRGGSHTEGFGLSGMRQRIGAIGGSVTWEGSNGTTLCVTVPAPTIAADSLEQSA